MVDSLSHWNTTRPPTQNWVSEWEQNSTDAIGRRGVTVKPLSAINSKRRTYSREHIKQIRVGLQPSRKICHARVILESVSHDMTAKQLVEKLSKRLRVDKDKWRLVVYSNDKAPYDLPQESTLEKFLSTTKERLYFFHE